jgi:hypothetical protein
MFGFSGDAHNSLEDSANYPRRKSQQERTAIMNRQVIPPVTAAPDLPAQITEIRLPMRAGRHNIRNEKEARP